MQNIRVRTSCCNFAKHWIDCSWTIVYSSSHHMIRRMRLGYWRECRGDSPGCCLDWRLWGELWPTARAFMAKLVPCILNNAGLESHTTTPEPWQLLCTVPVLCTILADLCLRMLVTILSKIFLLNCMQKINFTLPGYMWQLSTIGFRIRWNQNCRIFCCIPPIPSFPSIATVFVDLTVLYACSSSCKCLLNSIEFGICSWEIAWIC